MKKNYLVKISSLFIFLILTSCASSNLDDETPICIKNKIEELRKLEVYNPPAQIWKWEVDNQFFYYITSNCCDQYNYLYNENCEIICAPDGGIIGKGDGKCPTFYSEIIKTLIWKDTRE